MGNLLNQTISKVFAKEEREGEFGPYTPYDVYFEGYKDDQGNDVKFSYFKSGNKIVPVKGMKIAFIDFSTSQNGKYTNYKIKALVPAPEEDQPECEPRQDPPPPVPQPAAPLAKPIGNDVPRSMLLSYIKDIQVVRIQTSPVLADTSLAKLWREVEDVASGKEIPF